MPLTHGFSRSTAYVLLMVFAALLGGTALNIYYTNYVAEQSKRQYREITEQGDRRWCGLFGVYHDAYAQNPAPPTQLGKDIQAQLEALYVEFHCASVPKP